jgi:16S rRNA processing protein RimM
VNLPETEWITIAVLGKTRGHRGEITALSLSSKPERFQALREVFLFGGADDRLLSSANPLQVESTWFHMGTLVFKFRGVDTISQAELLTGAEVRVPASQRTPLEENEFFQSDLIGCGVFDAASGERMGSVTGWEDSGGHGLLVVDGSLLIPFARSICKEIDPAARRIAVELPEGLKDLNRT